MQKKSSLISWSRISAWRDDESICVFVSVCGRAFLRWWIFDLENDELKSRISSWCWSRRSSNEEERDQKFIRVTEVTTFISAAGCELSRSFLLLLEILLLDASISRARVEPGVFPLSFMSLFLGSRELDFQFWATEIRFKKSSVLTLGEDFPLCRK
jgi:hypothetical protein